MTSPETIFHEAEANFEVILLLIFMVAGVFFLKDLLLHVFTKILIFTRSKALLALTFSGTSAIFSAFLDALTVTAMIIAVIMGCYAVFHKVESGLSYETNAHDPGDDSRIKRPLDLIMFRAFLRSLVMHAAVGSALGGVTTIVGEPQNLLIANVTEWDFMEFFLRMAPISIPVLIVGLLTCVALERYAILGYGALMPERVRNVLIEFDRKKTEKLTPREHSNLILQFTVVIFLVVSLIFHVAEVGIIGLGVIILVSGLTGINEERDLGKAFQEALPFTALLMVFFAIVAVINDQQLFRPIINGVIAMSDDKQIPTLFMVNGLLSAVSDNVFVATIFINEVKAALDQGIINREQFEQMAIVINTGTNIPSVATPNGQAAFLFLLSSSLAPLIQLSYGRMVVMALPYVLTMTTTGLASILFYML
jgi:NhaB family Na+:H+ antiporter